jgi:hypothetical protein
LLRRVGRARLASILKRLTAMRIASVAALLFWLLPAAALGAPPRLIEVPRVGTLAVRPEGRPDLLLDHGRPLDEYLGRHGLGPAPRAERRGGPHWLKPIEKVRLDARRIWSAPSLTTEEKLERLVAVVQHRLPDGERGQAAHLRCVRAELSPQGEGFARLSRRTARRAGSSFERAWLLHSLLSELGVRATVESGQLVDVMARPRGNHAWLQVELGGRQRLIDPSSSQPLPETRAISVPRTDGHGRVEHIPGIETLNGWLYLPSR